MILKKILEKYQYTKKEHDLSVQENYGNINTFEYSESMKILFGFIYFFIIFLLLPLVIYSTIKYSKQHKLDNVTTSLLIFILFLFIQ